MIDKVQLIKEKIERLYTEVSQKPYNGEIEGEMCAYDKLISFIDSLPEEPASEDLEEEIQRAYYDKSLYDADNIDRTDFNCIARHFAEWQKEQHNRKYGFLYLKDCKDAYNEWKSTQENPSAALAWVRACEWQKQQMMKDAVDAFVNTYENTDDSNYVEFVTEQSPYKFKETEKCKLIIIKEEQQ